MQKTVQIPRKLFLELIKYHLGGVDADQEYINTALQTKLNTLANHERYSQAMNAQTDQECRELLQYYYGNKTKEY